MPRVDVRDGTSVFVQDVGHGRPVVLVPGFGLTHEVWDAQVRMLSGSHRTVALDPRGTGCSDKPVGGYSLDRLALDIEAVLATLDLVDVTLVGWSFGGQMALQVAAACPQRLAQLVLVASNGVRASRSDSFPFGADPDHLEGVLVGGEEDDRVGARHRNLAAAFADPPVPELLAWLGTLQLRMPSWAAIPCYRTYVRSDLTAALPRIQLPVLQLVGTRDPVTPVEGARWLRDRLPNAHLVELEGAGHLPMFETPDLFNAALLEFVSGGSCP